MTGILLSKGFVAQFVAELQAAAKAAGASYADIRINRYRNQFIFTRDRRVQNIVNTWNARTSDPAMITITQGSGAGNGNVRFNVGPSLSPRTGRITLAEGGGTCTVSQGVLLAPKRTY